MNRKLFDSALFSDGVAARVHGVGAAARLRGATYSSESSTSTRAPTRGRDRRPTADRQPVCRRRPSRAPSSSIVSCNSSQSAAAPQLHEPGPASVTGGAAFVKRSTDLSNSSCGVNGT